MPDPTGIQPPYLDPSQYPQYLDVQRKQMIANMLLGAMQRSGQTPQDWNSMKVVPRRGLMTNLAPLVSGLMAGKALSGAQQAEQGYFQNLYGGQPSGQPSVPAAPPSAPQAGPPGGPTAVSPTANAAPSAPAQPTGGNPMLLTGNPGTSQMLLNLMGPQEYGKGLAARYQPTELEKQLRAAGIDPASPLGQQMLQTQVAKTGYVPPVDVRPGGTLVDPFSRQPFFTGPQGNIQTVWGPNGPVAGPVPGGQEAQARAEGLETAAKVGNTPGTYPTAGGGSTVGYPGDILGTPPAMRGGTPAAPARGPIQPQTSAAATSGQSPAAGVDPWASMPKLYVPQGIGQADLYQQGRLKAAADKDSALSGKLGDEAALAEQQLEYNREAAGSLPNAETGPLSEWLTHNRSTLLELGVPEPLVPNSGSVTPTLELNKALKNAALQGARQIYGPRMTQTEVKLQTEEMSPSAGMMRDAISSLMQQNDIRSLYAKQRAQDYNRYQSAGGDPNKFESWYASKFPLTRFAAAAQASPADIQAELKRRGLAPP